MLEKNHKLFVCAYLFDMELREITPTTTTTMTTTLNDVPLDDTSFGHGNWSVWCSIGLNTSDCSCSSLCIRWCVNEWLSNHVLYRNATKSHIWSKHAISQHDIFHYICHHFFFFIIFSIFFLHCIVLSNLIANINNNNNIIDIANISLHFI